MTDQNYPVNIKLKTKDVFDIESRLAEINQLRAWLDELTEWQPDGYTMKFHSSGQRIMIWFKDQEAAIMCKLGMR